MRSVRESAAETLLIDLRMYRSSGIGRYLQTMLPDLIPALNAAKIVILGNRREIEGESWASDTRLELRHSTALPFSLAEQVAGISKLYREAGLLWVPQYNIPLAYRGKLLVTIHDLCQLAYPETLRNRLQRSYARHLLSTVASRARAIFCVSQFTAFELRKYLGVDPARITVCYPSIGKFWIRTASHAGQSTGAPYLLTVGNIKRHKNLRALVDAFARVKERIPHTLVIVGRRIGFLNADTELERADTLLDGRVRFTGPISDSDLAQYYSGAAALIFPSFYEGFGFPLLEAMALGCPVACSGVASLPEVAGDAALFFDPFSPEKMSEALVQIATDCALRERLIELGLTRAERFRGDSGARETAAVINRIALEK